MREVFAFDDVLLVPKFSTVVSRADVDPYVSMLNRLKKLPIISSNMDTVTDSVMASAMSKAHAMSCLHRFWTIEENLKQYRSSPGSFISVGVGKKELERFEALYETGATSFFLDVAHGASMNVVNQIKEMIALKGTNFFLVPGNFATKQGIDDFLHHLPNKSNMSAFKVSVGSGSMCSTRIVTGVGLPLFSTIVDCAQSGYPIIADGGIRNSGDLCKALAAGASAVMAGKLFAGCDESPAETFWMSHSGKPLNKQDAEACYSLDQPRVKLYRGSASLKSYEVQGKVASHRTPEGEASLIPHSGKVSDVLQQLEAGLRSSMSYLGAKDLMSYRELAEFVKVTPSGYIESTPHGVKA